MIYKNSVIIPSPARYSRYLCAYAHQLNNSLQYFLVAIANSIVSILRLFQNSCTHKSRIKSSFTKIKIELLKTV